MGNTQQNSNQGYEQVSGRSEGQASGNMQNRSSILRKIQLLYPQINNKELELFANSNRDIVFWSTQDQNFEQKAQKTLEKHFTSQENKYGQLIQRLYAHRQAQMKENNGSNQFYQNDQLSEQDMKIIFENASLLEKFDKMRDFFLIKHNNPLQLSLHATFLANTFKQILETGDRDEDLYITIVKQYTHFPKNLSKLLSLCGFIEFNEDGQTIGLYYEKKNLSLIKTLYRYLKQKYHQQIKPIETIIKEISEQNSFKYGSSMYSFDNYQQQQFGNAQQNLSQGQVYQQRQKATERPVQDPAQSSIDSNKNNFNHEQTKQKLLEQYKQAGSIQLSSQPLYQQISTVIQSKQVQERVKAQIEARQRREEQSRKGYREQQQAQQNQPSQVVEQQLFDEDQFVSQTSQQGVGISQFELQDFNPKETQEMRLGKALADQINKYRVQNKLQALIYNSNINATCEFHSRNIANGEVQFGHDGFDSRVREISLFADFILICESLVESSTPVDCSKILQELINNERHKKNLLSPTSHICIGVYSIEYKRILFQNSKLNKAYLTIIYYKSR